MPKFGDAEEMLRVMLNAEPFCVGQVVTAAYAGRDGVFGVISKITDGEDAGLFDLRVQWEDGEASWELPCEVLHLSGYAELTGQHYDAEYIKDKVVEKFNTAGDKPMD